MWTVMVKEWREKIRMEIVNVLESGNKEEVGDLYLVEILQLKG